jgi:hypothetical protein
VSTGKTRTGALQDDPLDLVEGDLVVCGSAHFSENPSPLLWFVNLCDLPTVQQAAVGAFSPDFNLEFAISDIDRAFCDAACEAVICWVRRLLAVIQRQVDLNDGRRPRARGRDLRALTGVVPSLVFPARRAADRTVKGRLCPPSGEMKTMGRAGRTGLPLAGRQQRHCRGLAGGTLDELYALAETNGREPCAASSEWPASQRKCSIRAILLPSTNAVPQAAPSSAQNRQAKERGEKGHSCEPT